MPELRQHLTWVFIVYTTSDEYYGFVQHDESLPEKVRDMYFVLMRHLDFVEGFEFVYE